MRSRASTGGRGWGRLPCWCLELSANHPASLASQTQLVSEAETSLTRLVLVGAVISIWLPQVGEGETSLCICRMSPAFRIPLSHPPELCGGLFTGRTGKLSPGKTHTSGKRHLL